MVFVYDKEDDAKSKSARLHIINGVFIEKEHTADYQTTFGINEILDRNGNLDDIESFLIERNLPLDEIGVRKLAEQILSKKPDIGCLTISNALQWRLQYGRAVEIANKGGKSGVISLFP